VGDRSCSYPTHAACCVPDYLGKPQIRSGAMRARTVPLIPTSWATIRTQVCYALLMLSRHGCPSLRGGCGRIMSSRAPGGSSRPHLAQTGAREPQHHGVPPEACTCREDLASRQYNSIFGLLHVQSSPSLYTLYSSPLSGTGCKHCLSRTKTHRTPLQIARFSSLM
jgi:hypothetical protein